MVHRSNLLVPYMAIQLSEKGTTSGLWKEVSREAQVYQILRKAQGSAVPVFLGTIDLAKVCFSSRGWWRRDHNNGGADVAAFAERSGDRISQLTLWGFFTQIFGGRIFFGIRNSDGR